MCGYALTDPDSPDSWMRGSGKSTRSTMAPDTDVTGSDLGYFAYVSGQNGQAMSRYSKLVGPTFSRSATNCRVQVCLTLPQEGTTHPRKVLRKGQVRFMLAQNPKLDNF